MAWKNIVLHIFNGVASSINATGFSGLWRRIRGPLAGCDMKTGTTCTQQLSMEAGYISLALSWWDIVVQFLVEDAGQSHWRESLRLLWSAVTDVIGRWGFYLAWLADLVKDWLYNYNQEDWREYLPIIWVAGVFALFSNVVARRCICYCCFNAEAEDGDEDARSTYAKFIDGVCEFFHGLADGRGLVLASENCYNVLLQTDQGTNSFAAKTAANVTGLVLAVFSAYVGYVYGPDTKMAEIIAQQEGGVRRGVRRATILFNGISSSIIFGVLMGSSIASSPAPYKVAFGGAFTALLIPITLHAICHRQRSADAPPESEVRIHDPYRDDSRFREERAQDRSSEGESSYEERPLDHSSIEESKSSYEAMSQDRSNGDESIHYVLMPPAPAETHAVTTTQARAPLDSILVDPTTSVAANLAEPLLATPQHNHLAG